MTRPLTFLAHALIYSVAAGFLIDAVLCELERRWGVR